MTERDEAGRRDAADETLSEAFWSVARQLRETSQETLAPWGITPSHLRALRVLRRHGPTRLSELSDRLHIAARSATEVVDGLQGRGLVERRPDPGDRRAHRLVLTDKARPILARILALSTEVRAEAFAGLSAADGRHLIDLLGRVHGNLSERVPPLAVAEYADLDEPNDHPALRVATASADLSPVGGHQ